MTDVLEFEMNPYDECTFNKVINDHQCTKKFYVDDLMVTHHEKQVIDKIFEKLDEQFGTVQKMSVKHGLVVKYLAMLIDFSEDGRVIFLMIDYLEDILTECTDYDMNGTAVWPAHEDLFKIDENSQKLSSVDGNFFHRIVAKLLFAAKQARPDIQLAVSFLCTRVKCPDVDDMQKLKRCIEYI